MTDVMTSWTALWAYIFGGWRRQTRTIKARVEEFDGLADELKNASHALEFEAQEKTRKNTGKPSMRDAAEKEPC